MTKFNVQGLLKYVPELAVVYQAYNYYSDRGFEGIIADLNAITIEGLKAKATMIITGVAAFIVAKLLADNVSNRYAKTGILTVGYYVGAGQIFGALRSGAGMGRGGAGRGFVSAGYVGNPYLGGRVR